MQITTANPRDVEPAVNRLAAAFAADPITGFLLQAGPGYRDRVTQFFSLLMRARLALDMPVLVARNAAGIEGAVMGYKTTCPPWPSGLAEEWDRFEAAIPGFTERIAVYDDIAQKCKPVDPHYYLGVIGADPSRHGQGVGTRLLQSFSALSAADALSSGVYLETANPANVRFYERAGFEVAGQGALGPSTLWCMFLRHGPRRDLPSP